MADRFANIKFGLDDKKKQVRTYGQFQPVQTIQDNDRDARMDSVPGVRTIAQQKSSDPQSPLTDPVRPVFQQPKQYDDVDVIIKLSALRKLKQGANKKPDTNKASGFKKDDELQVQR